MKRDWTAVRGGEILVTQQSVDEIHRLREENTRLRAEVEVYRKNAVACQEYDKVKRERDEAGQQLTCIDLWLRRREPVTHESATLRSVQEFIVRVEAEVARLEGLILGWALTPEDEFEGRDALIDAAKEIEARRIRGGRDGQ